MLVIYDLDGTLQAVSGSFAADESGLAGLPGVEDIAEFCTPSVAGKGAESRGPLPSWIAGEIREAKICGDRCSQTSIEHKGKRFEARFQTLTNSAGPFGYALQLDWNSDAGSRGDGSTVITRQQWHDIKNRLGGLKLYATFLRKRTCDGEDHEVVEKLLNGINGLIEHLARIRRGETK